MPKTVAAVCVLCLAALSWLQIQLACSTPPARPPTPVPVARDAATVVVDGCCCCPRDAGVPPVPVDGAVVVVPPVDGAVVVVPPPPLPTGHPRIMLGSQAVRLKAGLSAPAGVRWRATVDRWLSGADVYNFAAWNGALLSALTGDQRYCVKAVAVIEQQVSAAEVKIAAGATPEVAGDSYLQIGEMIGDLALVYDWCAASTTAAQRARWTNYASQAVSNVWGWKTATWGGRSAPWTGWGTDDPSNNYYYSFLRATMLLGLATTGESAAAAGHLAKFRERVDRLVTEFNAQLAGGGSREGTGYGVALRNLFELYVLWQWSTGEPIADRTPHTRASLQTMLATWMPTLDRKAPIGDQSRDSSAMLADYERAYVLELVALYPTAPEAARAVTVLAASSVPSMQWGFMLAWDFIYAPVTAGVPVDLPLVRYASGTGQIYARSSWSMAGAAQARKSNGPPKGAGELRRPVAETGTGESTDARRGVKRGLASSATWLNLMAGPFTQSHAHQDQGSMMLYKGGWLAYDAVITSHSGVRMEGTLVGLPEAHSLVRIEGAQQREGTAAKLLALHSGPGYLFAAVDVTPVYAGAVAMVRRQVLWLMPDVVVIQDHVVSSAAQTWQLVVPTPPVILGASATIGRLKVTRLAPAVGTWTAFDFRANSDFSGAWRLDQVQPAGDRTYVTVLAIDGAVSQAVATVRFSDVGCTFTLDGRAVTLGPGVDPL